MEQRCSNPGCPKLAEYVCGCVESKVFLCEIHLPWHISAKKNSEHSASRIDTVHEFDNKDCNVCMRKSGRYLCLCRDLGVKLCGECYDLHSLQNPGKHAKEPIEAADFIKDERDIFLYIERRDQVDEILKVISENEKDVQAKEEYFRIAHTKLTEKIKKWYEERLLKLSQTKRDLKRFQESIRACKFKKEISSHFISGFLKDKDYSKTFKTVRVELNEESLEIMLKNFFIIEQDALLSTNIPQSKQEPPIFITEKDTGSLYQRIQSIYNDYGPSLIPKLHSLFARALEPSKIETIQQVELSSCMLGIIGCRHVAALLPALIQLKSLNLSSNSVGPQGAKELAPGISQVTTLTTLILAWNKLESKGMEYLSESISELPQLRILQLSWNDISASGAQFLARSLVQCEKLEKLELWNNPLGPEGIRNLVLAIPYLVKLKTLDLNKTDMGQEGAEILAVVLPKLPDLTNLCIAGNNIGADGMNALSKGFGGNKFLQVIDIARNSIRGEGVQGLNNTMSKLQKETTIILSGNRFNKEERQKLRISASNHGLHLN